MDARVYSPQTRNGGHRKASVPRSPTGPARFQWPIWLLSSHGAGVIILMSEMAVGHSQGHAIGSWIYESRRGRFKTGVYVVLVFVPHGTI